MNNNDFLIPANTKNGALIFNIFTQFDLILFGVGVSITLIFLFIFPLSQLSTALIALSPALITGFLVLPIPNYHNVITLIREVVLFFTERRIFIWKGWCVYENFDIEKK